ncbi:hypothetical protein BDA99DRAFT_521852 [Phascolomyces articulosus]|uniref:Uncharacterized protein n=1 Tax=Phascolomyces articulosus TaxID=60185 RepID=A0AAD5PA65_9FUNG|nr:hypothetical protein BDA99DRAFT_521852 [Phascolomyces articulosus]
MGIFGLSAFVHEHVTLGVQHTWSSDAQQDSHDHFIIDGNAFTYHYAMKTNFNWVHGGIRYFLTLSHSISQTYYLRIHNN